MEWTCSTCELAFEPTEWMVKKWQHTCGPCLNKKQAAYRIKRNLEGRPIGGGKTMPLEYQRARNKIYSKLPHVRARAAAQARERRKDPAEQAKMASRRLSRSAIEMGKLVRQPCEVCEMEPADAHHDDYLKPLDIRWLCRLHHRRQHPGKLAKGGD